MNRIGIPESEQPALLAYLKRTYRYEDGGVVNRRTGRKVKGSKMRNGYLGFTISFNGNRYCTLTQRIVWALCNNELPSQTVDHINGDNNLNTLLPWNSNNAAGVAGVDKTGLKYRTNIQGQRFTFHNPYEAFYWAIACGKRYKPTPSPSHCVPHSYL